MTRKYRRMTVSFEVLMLAPENEDLDSHFANYDNDEKPVHESKDLVDLDEEDVLADISHPRFRESTCVCFQKHKDSGLDSFGGDVNKFAFLATLCERFFLSDITIHRPVEYEENTR